MNGTDIITFLTNNFPTVMSTVSAITGSLFTAIFLSTILLLKNLKK